jgi:beta-lactamase regulating signal transducer with metallopeptidase domain
MIDWAFNAALSNALASTMLAALAWGLSRIWRHPSWVYGLWFIVLLKFITPPLFELPLSIMTLSHKELPAQPTMIRGDTHDSAQRGDSEVDQPLVDSTNEATPALPSAPRNDALHQFQDRSLPGRSASAYSHPTNWRNWLIAIWMAGTIVWLACAVFRVRRFSSILAKATVAPPELQAEIAAVARVLSLRQIPDCRVVSGVMSPLIWPLRRQPILLVPASLIANLNDDERSSLWAHELAHLRRHDHWVCWLEIVALAIYWWHPVAWIAKRQLHRAAEEACDALVVWSFPDRARSYASALFKTIEFLRPSRIVTPPEAVGFGEGRQLKRRFEMILRNPIRYPLSRPLRTALFVAALIVLPLSFQGLWAQPKATNDVAKEIADTHEGTDASTATDVKSNEDIEARLRRVENLLEKLVQQSRPSQAADEKSPEQQYQEQLRAPEMEAGDPREKDRIVDADRWLADFVLRLERRLRLRETHMNRKIAAQRQVEALEAAYDAGTATLDILLDAQRRLCDAEIAYYQSTLDIAGSTSESPEGKEILLLLTLKSEAKARSSALQTWRKVHALYKAQAKGGEADKEAQAREQYYFYKGRIEGTLAALGKSTKPGKAQ